MQHVRTEQDATAASLTDLNRVQPVSVAAADLDGDGFQDLVVGYASEGGGFISIQRRNIDAFAPQTDESFQAVGRGQFPSPFLLEARTLSVPITPDFIALCNFLGNGNQDLLIASKAGNVLYVLAGDGKGNFGNPQSLNLPGPVSALAAGQLGISARYGKLLVATTPGTRKRPVAQPRSDL